METVVLTAQVLLAGVFAVAAIGKLADLDGSRRALTGFGIPAQYASVGGTLLPLTELAIALLLVMRPTAQWGGLAALVLLLVFAGAIGRAMTRGEAPDCNCFGALHSAPAGWRALARNGGLAAIAAIVAFSGSRPSIPTWVGDRSAAELVAIAAGLAAIGCAAVAARALWQNRRLRSDLASARTTIATIPPGLPTGILAPDFSVPGLDGTALTLDSLLGRGRPVALLFVRPGCGPSESLIPEVLRWEAALEDRLVIAVVGAGPVARFQGAGRPKLADAVAHDPGLQEEIDRLFELFGAYRLRATPSAVLLTPDGTIASASVHGAPAIESLLRIAVARAAGRWRAPSGALQRHDAAA